MAQALSSGHMEMAMARNSSRTPFLSSKPGGRAINLLSGPAIRTPSSRSLVLLYGLPVFHIANVPGSPRLTWPV